MARLPSTRITSNVHTTNIPAKPIKPVSTTRKPKPVSERAARRMDRRDYKHKAKTDAKYGSNSSRNLNKALDTANAIMQGTQAASVAKSQIAADRDKNIAYYAKIGSVGPETPNNDIPNTPGIDAPDEGSKYPNKSKERGFSR